jgi:nucleotide-binding universal stress UspA family protein
MSTFRRIVVAHDLTYVSAPALRLAASLARELGASLLVVHATEAPYQRATMLGHDTFSVDELELLASMARRSEAAARRVLQEEVDALVPPGTAEIVVRQGIPVDVVVRTARERECDLLVVGTHARRGLEHVLLGSVAERLARSAPCPVLMATAD